MTVPACPGASCRGRPRDEQGQARGELVTSSNRNSRGQGPLHPAAPGDTSASPQNPPWPLPAYFRALRLVWAGHAKGALQDGSQPSSLSVPLACCQSLHPCDGPAQVSSVCRQVGPHLVGLGPSPPCPAPEGPPPGTAAAPSTLLPAPERSRPKELRASARRPGQAAQGETERSTQPARGETRGVSRTAENSHVAVG